MESNSAVIARRWFDDVFGKGSINALDEIAAENLQIHGAGDSEVAGRDKFRDWLMWYRSTFVDSTWTITLLFEAGDKVVTRYRGTSTYKGGFFNIPANGQKVTETGITIFRMVDSRIVECWCEYSDLQVLEQLGALPSAWASRQS